MSRRPDGHCSIEEHPKGSGKYRVRARIDGEMKTVASGLTLELANDTANGYAEIRNAEVLKEGLRVADYGKQFLDRREQRGIRGIRQDRASWNKHITQDKLSKLALQTLCRLDILDWMDRRPRKAAFRTKLKVLNLLRVGLEEAKERGLIDENPAFGLKFHKSGAASAKDDLEGILTPIEQQALLLVVPVRDQPLVVFALSTGLRQAEQWWLQWDDVFPGKILVRRSSNGKPTKSGKPREVYLLPAAESCLKLMRADHDSRKKPGPFVFSAVRGGRRQEGKAPSKWDKWIEKAGIKRKIRWHDLRHTCATSLLAGWWGRKWSLDEVCKLLGHHSVTVTERYARKLSETLRLAVAETPGMAFEVPTMFPPPPTKALSRLRDSNSRPALYETPTNSLKKQRSKSSKAPPGELEDEESFQIALAETPGAVVPALPPSGGDQ